MALTDHMQAKGFDEGAFADARRARNAETNRLAGMRRQVLKQRFGLGAVVGAGGFVMGAGAAPGVLPYRACSAPMSFAERTMWLR